MHAGVNSLDHVVQVSGVMDGAPGGMLHWEEEPSACFEGLLAGLFRLLAGGWAAAGQAPASGRCAAASAD